ncbi:MAG: 7-cyano-7-deazaguanine synthase QueC [Candidatus Krumholzibacteriales bacterium]
MSNDKGLVLLSGGLDSTVALAMGTREYEMLSALFFDYGQVASGRERKASLEIARHFGIEFESIELPWLGDLSSSFIIGREAGNRLSESGGASDLWVENRNGIFLNIAAAAAVSSGCSVVIAGFNREEAGEFPDNSPEYLEAVNRALNLGERSRVRVESPTVSLDKREIVRKGIGLGVPWESIWSCYRGGERMCGECDSCLRLKSAVGGTEVEDIVRFDGE